MLQHFLQHNNSLCLNKQMLKRYVIPIDNESIQAFPTICKLPIATCHLTEETNAKLGNTDKDLIENQPSLKLPIILSLVWIEVDSVCLPCAIRPTGLAVPFFLAEISLFHRLRVYNKDGTRLQCATTMSTNMTATEADAYNILNSSHNYMLGFHLFKRSEHMCDVDSLQEWYWKHKIQFLRPKLSR